MKSKSIRIHTRFALSALALGVLTACGGGGSDSLDVADGGIRGTGSSVGPVSGFGSVFVNGVRFDTDDLNGQVQSDDGITTESELDEGMILRVDGQWRDDGTGTADSVEYDDTLRGPITVVVPWDDITQTAVISIKGLEVNIDRQTVIKGKNVDELVDGDTVRVSGWRLPDGDFRGSFVLVRSDTGGAFDTGNEIELEGQISKFISNPCSFEIGSVQVDCNDQGIRFETISRADLEDGVFVEVEGDMVGVNTLNAREIREDDQRRYRRGSNDDIEFSGPVSDDFDAGTSSFRINGLTVNVTNETDFDDDLTAQDLESGLLIQVEGAFQSDGSVTAEEIELREANAAVKGAITSQVDMAARTFEVGGVKVRVSQLTVIEDDEDTGLTAEQLFQSLSLGDDVDVEGIERQIEDSVVLEALKIERDEDEEDGDGGDGSGEADSFELEGKLRAIDDRSISVLGVTMSTQNTDFDDTDSNELQRLLEPDENKYPIVEVDYVELGAGEFDYRATEIELEENDDD